MAERYESSVARQAAQKEAILEQLRRMPIVQTAASKAGVSRATLYRMRDADPEFKAAIAVAMEEGVAFVSDMSEAQLVQLIRDKNFPAIKLWLQTHKVEYGRKVELSDKVEVAREAITDEEKGIIDRALRSLEQ